MPQNVQIVPKYLHPHVATYINDNTVVNDEAAATVDSNIKYLAVFRSPMGIDNTLIKKTSLADFYATFGRSNYKKYGQPLMMPIAELSSGNASVYCMRIMPDNSLAANSVLRAMYKADAETGKFTVKLKYSNVSKDTQGYSVADGKTRKAMAAWLTRVVNGFNTSTADEDGWKTKGIAAFRMNGRGVYGNNYRWRISPNSEYEEEIGIKMYSFETLSTDNGLSAIDIHVGSAVTSNKYRSITQINDIIDDLDLGSAPMDTRVYEDNIEALYNEYVAFINTLASTPAGLQKIERKDADGKPIIPALDEFDIFFGTDVATTTKHTNFVVEIEAGNTDTEVISVNRSQGITLAGGYDGDFGSDARWVDPTDPTIIITGDAAIAKYEIACYKNAFNGVYDNTLLSTRRTPLNYMFDANYPYEVKGALADLANLREDCLCYIDGGVETTLNQLDNCISNMAQFNTRNLSKEFQHYVVRDPETGKKCDVTTTYFIAQNIGIHTTLNGTQTPFVKRYAQLTGHIKDSLEPCINDIAMDEKEKLYKARINYFENIDENVYQRATQSTAQTITSDLLEESNMNVLFELKRQIEKDCWDIIYTFTSAEDRAVFKRTEEAKFVSWIGVKCESLSIDFDQSDFEAERSILHCYVAVVFRGITKRVIIEIDVNKRNSVSE